MENKPNNNNQGKKFFKKEGFYVILFVCLCVVAVIAAITIGNKKVAVNPSSTKKQLSKNNTKYINNRPDNALLVENTDKNNKIVADNKTKANVKIEIHDSGKVLPKTTSVSKPLRLEFTNPVKGTLARAYSEIPEYYATGSSERNIIYRENLGIDIKADVGTPVFAAADGIVEEVGENLKSYGTMVVIDHGNGLKTVYSNLDKNVEVKEKQKVKKGQEIGKVGNTTLRSAYEKYGAHLHFSILQGNGSYEELSNANKFIDPAKYVTYEKEEKEK